MAVYVFDDGKNKIEGMTKEQIIAAIAQATGETPQDVDSGFITTLKEQNAQRGVMLWVGTQAEYNAIETPDENTLYIVTDPDETNALQNQVDLLQAKLDKMNAVIWSYSNGVANGEALEDYAEFTKPLQDYQEIIVRCGAIGSTNFNVSCVKTGTGNFRGSLYSYGENNSDWFISVFVRRYYNGNTETYIVEAEIQRISAPFSGNPTIQTMVISQIRGVI